MLKEKEYQNKKEKISDFILGFFVIFVAVYLLALIVNLVLLIFPQATLLAHYKLVQSIHWVLIIALYLASLFISYKKRKYLALGILAEFIVALLLVIF
jgi:hypothetical protein